MVYPFFTTKLTELFWDSGLSSIFAWCGSTVNLWWRSLYEFLCWRNIEIHRDGDIGRDPRSSRQYTLLILDPWRRIETACVCRLSSPLSASRNSSSHSSLYKQIYLLKQGNHIVTDWENRRNNLPIFPIPINGIIFDVSLQSTTLQHYWQSISFLIWHSKSVETFKRHEPTNIC